MAHALLTLLFVSAVSVWLDRELRIGKRPTYRWHWVAAAVGIQLVASWIAVAYGGKTGNFLLHTLGGGVTAALLYCYFVRAYDVRISWRLQIVCLFAFVSTLGVMNELAEYLYELLGLGIMSLDTHDSWRDFVANTTGAFGAYGLVCLYGRLAAGKRIRP